jgi:hypothetical protein
VKNFIVTIAFILPFLSFAQKEKLAISALVNYHPTDFFTGFELNHNTGKIIYSLGLQVGINRSFFQQRMYPKIHFSIAKELAIKDKIGLQFSFRNSNSYLNVSSFNAKSFVFTEEPTLGTSIYFGNKLKVIPSIYWGYTFYWRSTVSSTNNWSRQTFFSPELKFSYAF